MDINKVVIILANGFEEIEAVSPIDILRRGGVDVIIAGIDDINITGSHGIIIKCDAILQDLDPDDFDGIVITGGLPGATNISESDEANNFIKKMNGDKKLIAAICASPAIVLSSLNILDGKKSTGYPGFEKDFNDFVEIKTEKVVVDGNIITSQGPGPASDFSFAVLEYLEGKDKSESVARSMLFN